MPSWCWSLQLHSILTSSSFTWWSRLAQFSLQAGTLGGTTTTFRSPSILISTYTHPVYTRLVCTRNPTMYIGLFTRALAFLNILCFLWQLPLQLQARATTICHCNAILKYNSTDNLAVNYLISRGSHPPQTLQGSTSMKKPYLYKPHPFLQI